MELLKQRGWVSVVVGICGSLLYSGCSKPAEEASAEPATVEVSEQAVAAAASELAVELEREAELAREAAAQWMTDFEAARAKALLENKALLLDFTGSDWCVWCIKLSEEVFSQAAFQDYAAEALVLVELDFPRAKAQSEELQKQNESLAQQYNISGFPTVLILSPEGELIEKTGYRRGGADAYVAYLKGILGQL